MSNEILVLGASGKVGRRVVEVLEARGAAVRPAGRSARGALFDWEQPTTWTTAVHGVERAYLIVPQDTVRPDGRLGEFLSGPGRTLRQVVLLSAIGVEKAEGTGMRAAEKLVESSGLDWTILRPNWFLQNFSEGFFAPGITADSELTAPAGEGRVSFVDTRDIGEVAAVALTTPDHAGRGYTLTGPEALTFGEVATGISAAGRQVTYRSTDPDETRGVLLGAGFDADYAELLLTLFEQIRAGHTAAVTDDVERVTGRPAGDLASYVRDNSTFWRSA